MPRMTRKRALAFALCHVWFVHGFVTPPSIYRKRQDFAAPSFPTTTTAQQQQSTVLVLQEGSSEIQQQPNITETLWTYARNIPQASRRHDSVRDQTRPVYSLVYFLFNEQAHTSNVHEPLERATIQAVRAASAAGDYRLIFRIVEAAIHFAQEEPILTSRLFGEAIESLSRTRCNVSKLKQMWKLAKEHESLIREPGLTAWEMNTMLKALSDRGKIRASLDFYEIEKRSIPGDAYTMSTLLTALTSSISENQSPSMHKDSESPCWQYMTGRHLLDQAGTQELNNYVLAAALRLNERAGQVFYAPTQRHYIAKCAMDLLQLMRYREISPDVVTCSLVASAFDKAYQSKAAVALLDAMVKSGTNTWSLPPPNEYVYSSVISACARCNEYEAAFDVLERMRNDGHCQLNTWVYNAALKACVGGSRGRNRKQRAKQGEMALALLNEMERLSENGRNTAPDTVTYNTVLAAIGSDIGSLGGSKHFSALVGLDSIDEWSPQEATVFEVVERMKENKISRDSLTYHYAIKATCSNEKAVLMILDTAIKDLEKGSDSSANLEGRAAEGLSFVFNTALSALSSGLGMLPITSILSRMAENQVRPNLESLIHLLNALGSSGFSDYVPVFLESIEGENDSVNKIREEFDIDVHDQFMTSDKLTPQLRHYSAAIKSCLSANDIDNALKVLSLMRDRNLSPDTESLEEIAITYCRLATMASAEESKIGRRVRSRKKKKTRTVQMDVKRSISAARARSALDIALSLENPSIHLLSTLAQSCCSAGMWAEGRMILGRLHNAAVTMDDALSQGPLHQQRRNDPMAVLPGLHRSLLKLSASKGNATAALDFVDDIQALTKSLTLSDDGTVDHDAADDEVHLSSIFKKFERNQEGIESLDVSAAVTSVASKIDGNNAGIGMRGEDWKLLLIAASKAGHWRLCLGTLQFLKPFLEATNPCYEGRESLKWKSKRYDKLARSLTAALLCFEIRGQYAWAIRAIEDWIEWSGRRPKKEAVLGAFRILSTRGQGFELNRLLQRVMDVQATPFDESESTYAEALCTGALNSLHQHGLYEDADELYLQACSRGYLPFSIGRGDLPNAFTIDLHGMNVAMAHSAVRIALQQYALLESQDGDLVIITGRGMNSAQRLRPVLRPEVQRMLLEEFYPPLSTTSVPGNMGALRVPPHDVNEWVSQQRQQKGVRMLAIADILKNLTSGERIRKSIVMRLQTENGDNEIK